MIKKYRFFGGFLASQEDWINKIAISGYRLIRTSKLSYEFEKVDNELYEYRIEYIGQKSQSDTEDYISFLESLGYKTFYKNINLNYSTCKVQIRPWADKGGRIATNETTLNREILIIERKYSPDPFIIHSTYEDRKRYALCLRRPWIYMLFCSLLAFIITHTCMWGAFLFISFTGIVLHQIELNKLRKQSTIWE